MLGILIDVSFAVTERILIYKYTQGCELVSAYRIEQNQ
ncbi:hypothetical protein Mpsy_0679 [Methanolobus psychrophilus R15]|nr:hypothetical protein Mpsy_0679 [Methanolobus psychrophilus R15]